MKTESPIEDILLGYFREVLPPEVALSTQVPIGRYRVDFLLERGGLKAVVECDGREFHKFHQDRWRDLALLDSGVADIIRFKGTDVHFFPAKCIELMLRLLPYLQGNPPYDNDSKSLAAIGIKSADVQMLYRSRTERGEPIEFLPPGFKETASSYRVCDMGDCLGLLSRDIEEGRAP